jgi:hypothetical protein
MAGEYVDTSALGRVLLGEPDAELIRDALAKHLEDVGMDERSRFHDPRR